MEVAEMIRMNVRERSNKRTHEWSYEEFTSSSMAGLARKLKKAGIPDQAFEIYREDKRIMSGISFHTIAGKMLVENDKAGLRYVDHREIPKQSRSQKKNLSLQSHVGSEAAAALKPYIPGNCTYTPDYSFLEEGQTSII